MILRKTKNLRFNMGHYEHVELYGVMEVDTRADAEDLKKFDINPTDLDAVMDFIDDRITEFLEPDVEMVSRTTDNQDSFVYPYIQFTATNK